MFGNPMLDVAIGLTFLYVMLSVMVTALQEYIAAITKLRSKTLAKGIEELVGSENRAEFFRHPLIFPLFEGGVLENGEPKNGGPSYIPARNFALAVFDLQSKQHRDGDEKAVRKPQKPAAFAVAEFFLDESSKTSVQERVQQIDKTARDLAGKITNEEVKTAVSQALGAAVGELKTATDVVNTAVKEIESLFDSTMRRAEGWYKVKVQRYTLGISIAFAVLINADSLYIGQRLWQDDDLRNQAVAAASAFYTNEELQQQLFTGCEAASGGAQPDQGNATSQAGSGGTSQGANNTATTEPAAQGNAPAQAGSGGTSQGANNAAGKKAAQEQMACAKEKLDLAVAESVKSAGFPLGWLSPEGCAWESLENCLSSPTSYFQKDQLIIGAFLGWFLTGLALSLGSSFWFDTLGKFMKVRQTGARESSDPIELRNPPQQGSTPTR